MLTGLNSPGPVGEAALVVLLLRSSTFMDPSSSIEQPDVVSLTLQGLTGTMVIPIVLSFSRGTHGRCIRPFLRRPGEGDEGHVRGSYRRLHRSCGVRHRDARDL